MEANSLTPGPATKAALALMERRRRKAALPDQTLPGQTPPTESAASTDVVFSPRPSDPRPILSTISNVSRQLDISMRSIRYYEGMGLVACVRGLKNSRLLDETAKTRLRAIVRLKALGLTLWEIADFLGDEAANTALLRERLQAQLTWLDEQRAAVVAFLEQLRDD